MATPKRSAEGAVVSGGVGMETSQVLAQFLQLMRADTNQLMHQMATNGVLDWFGRSVRGPHKIQNYLRYDVCVQYDHMDFEKVQQCEPIETKPTHMKTKKFPSMETEDYVNPKNKLTGITSLKPYADSDNEDDEHMQMADIETLPAGCRTPERGECSIIEALTPPASRTKSDGSDAAIVTDADEPEEDDFMELQAKRLKRTHGTTPFTQLRHQATITSKQIKRKSANRIAFDDSSSDEEETLDGNAQNARTEAYSPLHYLEATGILRAKSLSHDVSATTSDWDRPVRLRISYRQRIADGQPQFALIIYEHLARDSAGGVVQPMAPRRNLMSDFARVAGADDNALDGDAGIDIVEEHPALVVNPENGETIVATVATPTTEEIAAALETAAFNIVPLRTPTKMIQTPPATPKRKPRLPHAISGIKHLNLSPSSSSSTSGASTPKRSAARSLRL